MNNSVAEKQIPKKQISITDPNIINSLTFDYTYPGDTKYVYANQNGNWYGKNVTNNKVFNITKNYPAIAKNLASSAVKTQTAGTTSGAATTTPVTPATPTAPKKLTDMSKIELDIMRQNQPLDFKLAYNKLGAIEKAQVDKTDAVK
jgi:hypothetical protein